jgi:hypothetical protein
VTPSASTGRDGRGPDAADRGRAVPGVGRLRRFYGAQPLHLIATIVSFAIVAAGVAGWFQAGSDPRGIMLWVVGSVVAFEWLMLPLAWAFDRLAFGDGRPEVSPRVARPIRPAVAFVRVPAMLSALLALVSSPLILRLDTVTFTATTGIQPPDYLARWLLATAAMFAVSAVWCALTLRQPDGS